MDLIIFGIQGSGKGTQAKLLAEKFNLTVFEAGGVLRRIAQQETPLGKLVKETIEAGDLVRPEIVLQSLEEFMEQIAPDENVLFDGIPRSLHQKDLFDAMMKKHNRRNMAVILHLEKDEVLKRLEKRAEIEHRADDTSDAIAKRLEIFYNTTVPVIEAYKKNHDVLEVNGDQSIEAIRDILFNSLDKHYS